MSNLRSCPLRLVLLSCFLGVLQPANAQQSAPSTAAAGNAPVITKIDPPNWWATMPKPMLLIGGQHLEGAKFSLSDPTLRLERTHVSENGHWAELWLAGAPAKPETIQITVQAPGGRVSQPYTFAKRRAANDGFAGFSSKDVMYLIMTDRFADGDTSNDGPDVDRSKPRGWHGGDLRGIIQHLDYLQQLGVTTVWITPVYQNHEAQSYHGYGATDMYAVDEHFGSLDDLKTLSAELHRRGMKLVLDTVPNHLGPAHPWVEDSPEANWFHGTKANHRLAQGEFKPLTDPHAPWSTRRDVTEGWFANTLPDLNQENSTVARYLTENAVWWIEEAGLDGLRIDTFPYVGREFWHGYHAQLHALYPRLTTVGEVFNGDPTITSAFAGGVTRNGVDTGLDTPFDFPTYFALRDVLLHDAPMSKLTDVLRQDALYPHPERLVPFLGNHDTTRFLGESGATLPKLKLAFSVLLTMRGMPQIYSGDEIAMSGGADPDNRQDFPGGFPSSGVSENAFFAGSRQAPQQEMYDWVHGLLAVRHSQPALQSGEEQVLPGTDSLLVYVRGNSLESGCSTGKNRVLVLINKSQNAETITIPEENTALDRCQSAKLLWGGDAPVVIEKDAIRVTVPPSQPMLLEMR
ncbi:MAG TPA: alpha-amylase family glycosyl hydrolase [Granulicella sp.]|nr:alpha-amylase family glycosyl hydrolase [Granulicella sp.]